MCDEAGRPGEKLVHLYRDLAKGGVGLIISGYTYVSREGKQMPGKMGIDSSNNAAQLRELAAAARAEGGRCCIQLVHAGGQASSGVSGMATIAPSAIDVPQYGEMPTEMSRKDIDRVVRAFGEGAARAREYGFDALQIHGAHGYLVNEFLSPLTNRREDGYGGSVDNRVRFLMETYRSIRAAVGRDFPVFIKLNGSDNIEGGLTVEDAVHAAVALDAEGVDGIEVSGGTPASGKLSPVRVKIREVGQEAYNLAAAAEIRKSVSCKIMTVGGYRSFDVAEGVVDRGEADYISMSRPFIREPGLAARWQEGDRRRADCISCNGCFRPGLKEGGIYCVVLKKERERTG